MRTSSGTIVGKVASDFVGDIDEVRVFTRALSGAEIAALLSDFLPDVRVDDDPGDGGQQEVSLVSTVNGTWYAGWVDSRLDPSGGNYRCAYALSESGSVWSASEIYRGPEGQCGDPVVAANVWGGGVYRLGMSYTVNGPCCSRTSRRSFSVSPNVRAFDSRSRKAPLLTDWFIKAATWLNVAAVPAFAWIALAISTASSKSL